MSTPTLHALSIVCGFRYRHLTPIFRRRQLHELAPGVRDSIRPSTCYGPTLASLPVLGSSILYLCRMRINLLFLLATTAPQ